MASLPHPLLHTVGEHFGDVTVAAGTTIAAHRQRLNQLSFRGHRLEEKADLTQFMMNKLQFSTLASQHSLWLLSPIALGIYGADDLTNARQGGEYDPTKQCEEGEGKLFIPSYYRAAAGEGFCACALDVFSDVARLFAASDLDRLHLAHDPIKDSAGGEMILTFSRRGDTLWVSVMRWHPTIQHLLSCETPWLFCRAD